MSYETADILDAAADVIERDGWCQNSLTNTAGEFCALGALAVVAEGDPHELLRGHSGIRAYMALASRVGGCGVSFWNNDPERTQQEVLDTFRLAAKQERINADVEVSA